MVEFCDWLFLGVPSGLSLATAANFRLFLKVAIFLNRKLTNSIEDWIILIILNFFLRIKLRQARQWLQNMTSEER